ncbi:unnamed protein product [Lymnaea stagnalis]|uniref:UBX domain-containing protein n=1 Tax=Lymnaea stagnalis TaxID=6523 RepID=A0AAV2HGP9_LYMST
MDSETILKVAFQGFFLFAVFSLLLSWILPKLGELLTSWKISGHATNINLEDSHIKEQFKTQEVVNRQRIQQQYDSRAAEYNQNILLPRDEEKRRKKEEEFLRFLGPTWKGNGFSLGGGDSDRTNEDLMALPHSRRAAHRRIVQENINQEVAAAAEAAAKYKRRPKRVITLPEEPDPEELGVITILLRTPIGTTCTRRFYSTHQVQCLLDFITTQGFSQRKYTISTSYPRRLLDDPESCLADFDFGRRVVLNIEEKE